MRKVTNQIVHAFVNGKTLRVKNTRTDGNAIYLHGHLIAWKHNGSVYCTMAGWGTPTTRERLNGLARIVTGHCAFSQRKHVQYFNGQPVSESDIIKLT
jgi:hypothetical protein